MLVFAALYGCAQACTPVEKQESTAGVEKTQGQTRQEHEADLPAYEVTSNQGCTEGGIPGKCLQVSTDATSRKDFRALTEYFRGENLEAKAVVISFWPKRFAREASGVGAWFATKEAAEAFLGLEVPASDIQCIKNNGGFFVNRVGRTAGRRSSEETTHDAAY